MEPKHIRSSSIHALSNKLRGKQTVGTGSMSASCHHAAGVLVFGALVVWWCNDVVVVVVVVVVV